MVGAGPIGPTILVFGEGLGFVTARILQRAQGQIGDLEVFQKRGATLYAKVHATQVLDAQATKKGILDALKKVTAARRSAVRFSDGGRIDAMNLQ